MHSHDINLHMIMSSFCPACIHKYDFIKHSARFVAVGIDQRSIQVHPKPIQQDTTHTQLQ